MRKKQPYHEITNFSRFKKACLRKAKLKKRRSGWFKYFRIVIENVNSEKFAIKRIPKFLVHEISRGSHTPHPAFSENIKFLAESKNAFSKQAISLPQDGIFEVPNPFSLTENYEESFLFLKKLFYALYTDRFSAMTVDYLKCKRIDIDASACMDILLAEFIKYYKQCSNTSYQKKLKTITPVNYDKDIEKILFSIGAFKTLKKTEKKFDDIIPFPLIIGDNFSPRRGADKELEVTKMVDYIVNCLGRTQRVLTWEAEDNLSKVIGEVLINAAEHSGQRYRYSIGYFQEVTNDAEKVGVFNLAIFGFGKTIYESFKELESQNLEIVNRMRDLSEEFTTKNLFSHRKFEEETLWTLYALQEGVTSIKDKKRGNGSIHFIESFFELKGDTSHDNSSSLTLLSGNTRIIFDGRYGIVKKRRGNDQTLYKMMTFNDSGNIEDIPDKKNVTFAENFFPGTLIVAKIFIKFRNIEKEVL